MGAWLVGWLSDQTCSTLYGLSKNNSLTLGIDRGRTTLLLLRLLVLVLFPHHLFGPLAEITRQTDSECYCISRHTHLLKHTSRIMEPPPRDDRVEHTLNATKDRNISTSSSACLKHRTTKSDDDVANGTNTCITAI